MAGKDAEGGQGLSSMEKELIGIRGRLKENEEEFRRILYEIPVSMSVITPEGRVLLLNQKTIELFDLEDEDISEYNVLEIWEEPKLRDKWLEEIREKGLVTDFEMNAVTPGGFHKNLLISGLMITFEGRPCILSVHQDVTEKIAAEAELRMSREKYRSIVDNLSDMLFVIDTKGIVTYVSKNITSIIGYSPSEVIGKDYTSYVHPDDITRRSEELCSFLSGKQKSTEFRIQKKDGDYLWIKITGQPVVVDGEVTGIQGVLTDITDLKETEDELRETNDRLLHFSKRLSILNEIITTANESKDFSSLFRNVLDSVISLTNYDAGAIYIADPETKSASIVYSVKIPENMLERVETVPQEEPPFNSLFIDGKAIISNNLREFSPEIAELSGFSSLISVPLVSKGRIIGALNGAKTEQREIPGEEIDLLLSIGAELGNTFERFSAEEKVKLAAENFKTLFNSIGEMLFILDMQGRIIRVNDNVVLKLGYSKEELIGKNVLLLHPEERQEEAGKIVKGIIAGTLDECHIPLRTREGMLIDVETRISHGWWNNQKVLFGVARDVSKQKKTEQALSESEIKFRSYVENAPYGIFITDSKGRYIDVNPAACEMTGYSRDEMLKMSINDIASPDAPPETISSFKRLIKMGEIQTDLLLRKKDGTDFYVLLKAMALGNEHFMGFCEDITSRKEAEEALQKSEEQYRAIYDNSPIAIELYDSAGHLIHANPACLELFGVDEINYISNFSLFDDPNVHDEDKKLLAKGKTVRYESEFDFEKVRELNLYPTKKTGTMWLNVLITPLKRSVDSISGYLVQIQDITDRMLIAEELRKSEEKYRDLADNAPVGILTCDRDGRILYANSRVPEILGSPSVEKTMQINLLTNENLKAAGFSDILTDVVENGAGYPDLELEYTSVWGKKLYLRLHISSILKGSSPDGARLIIDDITSRRETEALLERTQFAFDHSPDEIYFVDRDGRIVYANAHAGSSLGISTDPRANTTVFDINPEFTPEKWRELWQKLIDENYVRIETVHRHPGGTEYPVDIIKYPINFEGEEYSCSISRDITDRKRVEEELRESEGRLRTLIKTIPDLIWLKDEKGIYLACNTMFEQFFGAKENEIVGKTDYDFVDKELADFFREKDILAVEAGKPTTNEEWITFAADGRRAYLETIKAPVYDFNGNVAGVLGIGRDITERKKSEDAIKEVNRKLNLLSSITRHDILNQIMVAAGYLEIIKLDDEIPHGTKAEEYIEKISGAVDTIRRQITFTGYYKDLGEQAPDWFDVGEIVNKVGRTSSFGDIRLINNIENISVFADPLFEKVIYNLIDNAVKHGETITKISFYTEENPGELVIVCEDDGVGIPDEYKEKIFRREHYKNSGLGLFLSGEILAITGLTLTETGTPGEGAKFEIHVPEDKFRRGGNE